MIPDIKNRSTKTVGLFCDSLFWDYSKIEEGECYTYGQLISLIKDDEGNILPRRKKIESKDIQFEAWGITLDLEEVGNHAHKSYLVTKKRDYDIDTRLDIADEITQEYLLSRDNKSGLIYNIILFLLKVRGRVGVLKDKPAATMEFSKSKWEVEVGMVSRVFQKMLFNGDNILTQSILGNILKMSVDEVKKNIFLRALEFIGKDPDIVCKVKTKVLYIDLEKGMNDEISDAEAAAAHKIKYQDKVYEYKSAYANDFFLEMVGMIEDQVLSDMEFDSQREVVAAGKYPEYRAEVNERVGELGIKDLLLQPKGKEDVEVSANNGKYKILNYWKVYEISIAQEDLDKRLSKIVIQDNSDDITTNEVDDEAIGEDLLKDNGYLVDCLAMLKRELNDYIEMRVSSKVNLSNFDFKTKEGEKLAEELSWIAYFSKYAQYRSYSPREWNNFLLGGEEEIIEKDGVKFIFDNDGAISGMVDDNYNKINFAYPETEVRDSSDEFSVFSALEKLAYQIINENKSLLVIRDKYNKKMGELLQSVILSSKGEISEYGLDLDKMNEKIRELMQTQFKPQKDAMKIARKIINLQKKG